MSFWKKKETPLNSDEYEKLLRKIVAMVADIDSINNKLAILDGVAKSNRLRVNRIKLQEVEQESEKNINDGPKYI